MKKLSTALNAVQQSDVKAGIYLSNSQLKELIKYRQFDQENKPDGLFFYVGQRKVTENQLVYTIEIVPYKNNFQPVIPEGEEALVPFVHEDTKVIEGVDVTVETEGWLVANLGYLKPDFQSYPNSQLSAFFPINPLILDNGGGGGPGGISQKTPPPK